MNTNEKDITNRPNPITSLEELNAAIQEAEQTEQLYSIALFDILGFSNFVQQNKTQEISDLYNKLIELIHNKETDYTSSVAFECSVVPMPVSPDWKYNQLVANANGYVHVCHFSDTFLIYTNFLFKKTPWALRDSYEEPYPLLLGELGTEFYPLIYEEHQIYLSFLQICMEFFCEAIQTGIPLRGCVSTGMAIMDKSNSIYFGRPLVEAARGEPAQNAMGIAFGKSFNNYHPVYNRFFIPYYDHIKKGDGKSNYLSPMMLDWPRFWRNRYPDMSITDSINKMNIDPAFSSYYDNAIKFSEFSKQHENWAEEIDRTEMTDIQQYYSRIKAWYNNVLHK